MVPYMPAPVIAMVNSQLHIQVSTQLGNIGVSELKRTYTIYRTIYIYISQPATSSNHVLYSIWNCSQVGPPAISQNDHFLMGNSGANQFSEDTIYPAYPNGVVSDSKGNPFVPHQQVLYTFIEMKLHKFQGVSSSYFHSRIPHMLPTGCE